MKVSHEVPKCLLNNSPEFNDYDYCLPHLLDKDKQYLKYFREAKAKGRYIIMDNSLHELGEAYDHERLMYWINELEPDEFIVPDVWENKTQTLVNAKHWKQFTYPEKTTPVAVVQAKSYGEAYECYHLLKELGYEKIAFSYGAAYYNEVSHHPNKDMGKALGRIIVISMLFKAGIISKTDRVHLLGCSVPQEFGWYKDHPYIETIDTSNPIMAALENVEYTERGLDSKPKANMNDFFDIDGKKVDYELVLHNTTMFREINGLAYNHNIPGTI
jgi:hypothetical protein